LAVAAFLFSKDYKYSRTPTAALWARWDECSVSEAQETRMGRALDGKLTPLRIDESARIALYLGGTGKKYRTTLVSCSCPDFKKRRVPCKHMYLLANRLNCDNLPKPRYFED
jgi:hypothetical protein